jgi:hypothetical protein
VPDTELARVAERQLQVGHLQGHSSPSECAELLPMSCSVRCQEHPAESPMPEPWLGNGACAPKNCGSCTVFPVQRDCSIDGTKAVGPCRGTSDPAAACERVKSSETLLELSP